MYNLGCFISNRATYYRQKVLLQKLEKDKDINLILFVASSLLEGNYENTFGELCDIFHVIPICVSSGDDSRHVYAEKMASYIKESSSVFSSLNLNAILLIADRWELLPIATTSICLNIPIIHIQGGEDTSNIDQKVRHAISMMSDLHLVSHEFAAKRLEYMKLKNVYITGCPSIDLIKENNIKRYSPDKPYIICMFHPHTNEYNIVDTQTKTVINQVCNFCNFNNIDLHWFAPNNDLGHIKVLEELISVNLKIIYNLKGEEFLNLLAGCKMIVGNSSCSIREASYLGIPSVVIGDRQKDRICSDNVIWAKFQNINEAMKVCLNKETPPRNLFGDGNSSELIIKHIKGFLNEMDNTIHYMA